MNKNGANLLGVAALVGWSLNIAVTRHLTEAHVFGMPGLSFCLAGATLIVFDALRGKAAPWRSDADRKFWIWGGGAFVAYGVLYTLGVSWSDSRAVTLPLGLINYFWPVLLLVMMPFFFSCRLRAVPLICGLLLCLVGVGMALLWGLTAEEMLAGFAENWPAFGIMLAAAFLWAFYSNAARKWAGTASGTGWFELATGLVFVALWLATGGSLGFSSGLLVPFLLHAVLVNAACYLLWDFAVRYGDIGLMGTLANFLPLGSVLFGVWYLGSGLTVGLGVGCALVTAGAVLCRKGVCETGSAR